MCDRNQFSTLLEDVVDETLLLEDEDEDETLLLEDEHDQKESRPDRPTGTIQREVIVNNVLTQIMNLTQVVNIHHLG